MKRIFSFLFAIIALVGTTGVFTSCQEDAVEIDYTISVTVNNDLTEVINAINNGNLSTGEGIQSLIEAINKLSGDQETKYQALLNAINGLATTLEAKLAVLEAAMQAQALALEGKLDLLAAAIEALPDYTEKLDAIAAAIKALPDYSDKLAAIEAAIAALPDYSEQLGAIQAAIEAIPDYTEKLTAIQTALEAIKQQNTDNATAIADLQDSIDDIAKAVEEGNKSQDEALTEIIDLLDTTPRITFTTNKAIGDTIMVNVQGELAASQVKGAVIIDSEPFNEVYTDYYFKLTSQKVTIKQASTTYFFCVGSQITSMRFNNCSDLETIYCRNNEITGENMTNLVNSLPDRTGKTAGKIIVYAKSDSKEKNEITKADVAIAKAKNWKVLDWYDNEYEGI